jgi:hypothetical protein
MENGRLIQKKAFIKHSVLYQQVELHSEQPHWECISFYPTEANFQFLESGPTAARHFHFAAYDGYIDSDTARLF